ncbi:putative membrane protein [Duffyella gerundensis]|uniref:Putative membrane protein n=1 Tax=Duffyella gerundensis TaxID=1619313 RepID=A0A0U5L268_9GAMM|nr:putative membrane protein [Duffyella gerundensis]
MWHPLLNLLIGTFSVFLFACVMHWRLLRKRSLRASRLHRACLRRR